jgi:FKBP-type peptidyl-prolyl cis-trans isomerase 2
MRERSVRMRFAGLLSFDQEDPMSQAKSGDTVVVHYTGKLPGGPVFDSSRERQPLKFQLGQQQIIPGFEQAVIGMAPGETRRVTIPPDKAYGPHKDDLVVDLDRATVPAHIEPHVGERVQLQTPDGQQVGAKVVDVSSEKVTLDANHPLAGREVEFEIELVEIA